MSKHLFSIAVLSLCVFVSCSSEPSFTETEEIGPYTVSLIEKNVWHIEDCNSSNPAGMGKRADGSFGNNNCSDMYIIRGKKKALLIDLSNKINWAENADEALRTIFYDRAGDREKVITITHNHGDHVGMLYAFKDEEDVTFLLPDNDFAKDKSFPEGRKSLISSLDIIDLGGMVLQCVQAEGHTPGSMVFFLKGHDLAFSGDAIGSGTGVWIFSYDGFLQYTKGVPALISYINDPANGVDASKLVFRPGHVWQHGSLEKLDMQYLLDMQTLIEKIGDGTADCEPYSGGMRTMNANFKYGTATITWNKEQGERYHLEQSEM